MAKDWFSRLAKLEGAVVGNYDPHANVIQTPSPSVNFAFGNGWGLPLGFTMAIGGPPKGGKTLLCNAIIGQLHRDDPDAVVAKFDTEFREQGQLTDAQAKVWGIDKKRYMAFSVNAPSLVFDTISKDLAAMCDEGMPLKLLIIDSITNIQGRRSENADSVDVQQIGDHALTIGDGLKRILPVIRKHKIAMILTCHIRAEMDQLEQRRGNKVKMALPFGAQHVTEYFMYIEPNRNKEGRTDLNGNEFRDGNLEDLAGNKELTGHKIRVRMKDNSMGPKGRVGEFTLDYHRGIINQHEEIFLLGVNRGVIEHPNAQAYIFGDRKWQGKPATLTALKDDPELQKAILFEVKRRDNEGAYSAEDAAANAIDDE